MTIKNPRRIVTDAAEAEVVSLENQKPTILPRQSQSSAATDRRLVDDLARQFLRLILPDRGHYVSWIRTSHGRKYNRFASAIEELWIIISEADGAGHTGYQACASFKEARHDPRGTPTSQRRYGRTQYNVLGARSLWLDVDAGPDKPYAEWRSAAQAVATFCKATGLPPPLYVRSGLGIHVYWPLEQVLDPETWRRYALGLKSMCVNHGLHADPNRTADITSVLRTPGTHHRKAGVRLVECLELAGPYSVKQFEILLSSALDNGPKGSSFLMTPCVLPPYLSPSDSMQLTETLARNTSSFEPSSGSLIADRCEQVRALRDSKGRLSEPLWYSGVSVLAFAQDGEPLAHAWSSGDPRYTECETQARLERARQMSGPTTCQRFHDLQPPVCQRCKWWGRIKSPIVLGQRRTGRGV
jgi:hypothetical protein